MLRAETASRLCRAAGAGLLACLLGAGLCCTGCATGPRAGSAAASNRSYAFWPLSPDEPRVQFLRSFSSSSDVDPVEPSVLDRLVFGEKETEASAIKKPYGVAMHDAKIYVCDIRRQALVVLDLNKRQTRLVGVVGLNRLKHPVAVAIADDGLIYVADNDRGAVVVFDRNERFVRAIGHDKFKPVAVAVHGERLYVCDTTALAQKVEIFDRRDGRHLGVLGTGIGDEDGQFRLPLGVDTDGQGNVYVSDMMRCRIQKFGPDGALLAATGTLGDYAGSFARPKHLAVDRDGITYVVDSVFQNVQMFDDQNRLLMAFGAAGDFPGAMNLPVGVCVYEGGGELFKDDAHPGFEIKRLVVVTNQFGPNKVSVYAMGQRREGWAAADLAKSAAPVSTGTGGSTEQLKLQMQGTEQLPPVPEQAPAPEPPAPPKPTDTGKPQERP
jgi:hypothetical protein